MVGSLGKHSTVLTHKGHRVIDISGGVGGGVGGISCASYHFPVPTGKGIGVGVVRCSFRIGRGGHRSPCVIVGAADLRAVPIHEHDQRFTAGQNIGKLHTCVVCSGSMHDLRRIGFADGYGTGNGLLITAVPGAGQGHSTGGMVLRPLEVCEIVMSKGGNFFLHHQNIPANFAVAAFGQTGLRAGHGCRICHRLMGFACSGLDNGKPIAVKCLDIVGCKPDLERIPGYGQGLICQCGSGILSDQLIAAVVDVNIVIIGFYPGLTVKGNAQRPGARIGKDFGLIHVVGVIVGALGIQRSIHIHQTNVMHINLKFCRAPGHGQGNGLFAGGRKICIHGLHRRSAQGNGYPLRIYTLQRKSR